MTNSAATKLVAFHGDARLRDLVVAGVRAHADADDFIRGTYRDWRFDGSDNSRFRGCAVGCTLDTIRRIEFPNTADPWIDGTHRIFYGDHTLYERYLGVPANLAVLEDHLFEHMPIPDYREWPVRFIEAIVPGTDLSQVADRFALDLVSNPEGWIARTLFGRQEDDTRFRFPVVAGLQAHIDPNMTTPTYDFWSSTDRLIRECVYEFDRRDDETGEYLGFALRALANVALSYSYQSRICVLESSDVPEREYARLAGVLVGLIASAPMATP